MSLPSRTYKVQLSEAKLFVTIAREDGRVKHVFANIRTFDQEQVANAKAIATLVWLHVEAGQGVKRIIKHLKGISGGNPVFYEGVQYLSIPDAIAKILEEDENERA